MSDVAILIVEAIAKLRTLTLHNQQTAIAFIEFLATQEESSRSSSTPVSDEIPTTFKTVSDWHTDPFFGIWRDREDLHNSTAWVRQIRQQQWSR
jgi:hypothetical protein